MLTYPEIDPVIFSIGPLQLRWYSLMYIIGLSAGYWFLRYASRKGTLRANYEQIEGIMGALLFGLILGARLTYVFVYNFDHYISHPAEILQVWKGGLSFHGALIGLCLAIFWYCRRHKIPYFNVMDHCAVVTPIGLGFGRMGNFINGELWGRVTDAPVGMIFPGAGPLPRHPSQLYEAFFEGVVLLIILSFLYFKKPRVGVISAAFLLCYGTFRFFIEFFREPDSQLGTVLGPFSMGQILCGLMWLVGGIVLSYALQNKQNFFTTATPQRKL